MASDDIAASDDADDGSPGAISETTPASPDPENGDDQDGNDATSGSVRSEVDRLPQSHGRNVRVVNSESELNSVFGRMTRGGRVDTSTNYPGRSVVLRDGTRVSMRGSSRSGGSTVDVRYPNGQTAKVHIKGGG